MRATAKGQGKPKLLGLVLCTVVVTTLIYVAFVVYGKGSYAGEESSGQVSTVVRTEIPRATQQNTIELKESSKIDGTRVIGRPSYEGGAARTTARTVTLHNDRQGKRTVEHNTAVAAKVPWNEFVATPITERGIVRDRSDKSGPLEPGFHPVLCSNEVVNKLASPRLSTTDFEWCKWAISYGWQSCRWEVLGQSGIEERSVALRQLELQCSAEWKEPILRRFMGRYTYRKVAKIHPTSV